MLHNAMFLRDPKIEDFIDGLVKDSSTNARQVQSFSKSF